MPEHQPKPEFESALYGAAGVAHNAALTRLLLERGADPNDGEVVYHSPEETDNAVLKLLVETGRLTPDSLVTMLVRKADWHDYDGIKFLLEHGADPNHITHWGFTGLHQALRRDNALPNIEAMLDHGADALIENRYDGKSSISLAARRGRADVLELFGRRGISLHLADLDRLIAACACNDVTTIQNIRLRAPGLLEQLRSEGGQLLAEFAGNGNTNGVRQLIELGVQVQVLYKKGDGYFEIARDSTALHVAAWRARHETVKFLIERGANIEVLDAKGRTPLMLAVRACVDSHWQARRSPESVRAFLQAGASKSGVHFPTGYAAIDDLLQTRGTES